MCWNPFLNEVKSHWPAALLKGDFSADVFLWNCEIFRNLFSIEHLKQLLASKNLFKYKVFISFASLFISFFFVRCCSLIMYLLKMKIFDAPSLCIWNHTFWCKPSPLPPHNAYTKWFIVHLYLLSLEMRPIKKTGLDPYNTCNQCIHTKFYILMPAAIAHINSETNAPPSIINVDCK